MSGMFGRQTEPIVTALGGVRIQTSLWGVPIPIVFGRNRIAGNLIWYSDFFSQPVNTSSKSGKGGMFGGGGKGGNKTYDYGAAVMIALCRGPIGGVLSIWDTQGTLPVNDTSENFIIGPSSNTYNVQHQMTFIADLGCTLEVPYDLGDVDDYGSPGPVEVQGNQQIPLIRGTDYTESDGSYQFNVSEIFSKYGSSADNVTINYSYGPPNTMGSDPITSLNLTLFEGAQGQSVWSWLESNHPAQALAYTLLAYMANSQMDLGTSGMLPNLSFEVLGLLPYGHGQYDADPADILNFIFTDSIDGVGLLASEIGSLNQFETYCIANGIFLSPVFNEQRTAADYLDDILKACNSELIRNGFQLLALPYGDTTVVGNGATFSPQTQPIYDLDDDDFVRDSEAPPISVERPSIQDAYNSVKIQFTDRANNYNSSTVEAKDLHAIELYKYRPESPRDYDFVCLSSIASTIAQTALSRLVNIRNKFKFKLPATYIGLDPMDLVTVTDVTLGLNKSPVRITKISEDKDKYLSIEAEEFPWGCCGPTLYPKQVGQGAFPNASTDPGNVNPPIVFEAPPRLRGTDPHQEVWVALSGAAYEGTCNTNGTAVEWASGSVFPQGGGWPGAPIIINGVAYTIQSVTDSDDLVLTTSAGTQTGVSFIIPNVNWGGAQVWMSTDGANYVPLGAQQGASIMGVTAADWPPASDPDATNDLQIDLTESLGNLENFSLSEEDSFHSLFLVSGGYGLIDYELGAYGVAQLTAPNKYTLKATGGGAGPDNITASPNGLVIAAPISVAASGLSEIGNVVSVQFQNPLDPGSIGMSLQVGDQVEISGAGVSGYNGTFLVVALNLPYGFSVLNPTSGLAASGGGSVALTLFICYLTVRDQALAQGMVGTISGAGVSGYNGSWQIRGWGLWGVVPIRSYVILNGSQFGLAASGGGTLTTSGNHLRRNVFGCPNGPNGGVDHPGGSTWVLLTGPIFKIQLDPGVVGKTLYLKFTSFNVRGNMEQSLANVQAYVYTPQGLQQGLYAFGYSLSPSTVLSQDTSVLTTIDVAAFQIRSTAGIASYLGTKLTGLSYNTPYYVYVYDPTMQGESSSLGRTCVYAADTSEDKDNLSGWFFLGSITLASGGGASGGPGGGGGGPHGHGIPMPQ
jgi:hypothetical protein